MSENHLNGPQVKCFFFFKETKNCASTNERDTTKTNLYAFHSFGIFHFLLLLLFSLAFIAHAAVVGLLEFMCRHWITWCVRFFFRSEHIGGLQLKNYDSLPEHCYIPFRTCKNCFCFGWDVKKSNEFKGAFQSTTFSTWYYCERITKIQTEQVKWAKVAFSPFEHHYLYIVRWYACHRLENSCLKIAERIRSRFNCTD